MANKTYKLQDISRNRKLKLEDYIRFHWCRAFRRVYGDDTTYNPRLKPKSYEFYTKSTEKWLWHLKMFLILRRERERESKNWIV